MKTWVEVAAAATLLIAQTSLAQSSADRTPATNEISDLVAQLSAPDYRQREEASRKLSEIGETAIPALHGAIAGKNPEAAARAEAIARRIQQRPLPMGPMPIDQRGTGMRVNTTPSSRMIDGWDRGRHVVIHELPGELKVEVTGTDTQGRVVTEAVTAADAKAMERDNPEAAALYQRWANAGGTLNGEMIFMQRGMGVPDMLRNERPPRLRGGAFELQLNGPFRAAMPQNVDNLGDLELRLLQQMNQAKTDLAGQKIVLEGLRNLRDAQLAIGGNLAGDMVQYNRASDALRQSLEALKLPDPGEALPPPARARLGVSVRENPDGIVVIQILPNSRAEILGLKADDAIARINDQPVESSNRLRQILQSTREPLRLEIIRDGKPLKLQEKAK